MMSENPAPSDTDKSVQHQPSETAMATATMRAIAAHDEREEIRGADNLAELFLSEDRLTTVKDPVVRQWVLKNKTAPGAYEFMIARTAFFDHAVKDALLHHLPQLVLLGAGYDSRSYRFKDLAETTHIFELDAAPTQQRKQEILERAGIPMPPRLTFVPIDFSTDDLVQTLTQNGFSSTERVLFIWEGVTYYLTAEAVDNTLAAVRSISAAGNEICFDYASLSSEALSEERAKVLREHMRTKHSNELTRFGIPYGTLDQFLGERGYQIIENLDASEMEAKYLTLRDGSVAGKVATLFSLVRAAISG
jgi:methyltransferase (TIGR00027 family)